MDANQREIAQNFTGLKKQGLESASDGPLPYNPLIQAANYFFSATKNPEPEKVGSLQQQLLDNLDAFQHIVLHYYAEAVALMSIYILCFTLDTLMVYRLGSSHETWGPYNLVKDMFQYDDATNVERMLDAIDFLCLSDDADTHLLEFAYVCMSLAVKNNPDTHTIIYARAEAGIDKLYKKIYDARAGFKTNLIIKPQALKSNMPTQKSFLPSWLIVFLTVIIISTAFFAVTFLFNLATENTVKHVKGKRSYHTPYEKIETQ